MSAIADAEIGLPVRLEHRVRHSWSRLWDYLRAAGPFFAALLVLKLVGAVGLASTVHVPWLHQGTIVRLLLNSNIYVLETARGLPLWLFVLLAVPRSMVGDPLNYYLAQRSAGFVKREVNNRVGKWIAAKVLRLEKSRPSIILVAVFCLTFTAAWIPTGFNMAANLCNPYWVAGAARIRLRWVLAVDLAARLAFLVILYHFGTPWAMALNAA